MLLDLNISRSNVAPEIAMNYLDRAEDLLKNISNEEELVAVYLQQKQYENCYRRV